MRPPSDPSPPPFLSVAMPTYNGARYLPEALESIAVQRGVGDRRVLLEVLAVDDGSADATPRILQEASARLPLRVLDGPRRRNWVVSTNVALRAARGEFVCMLHQDDRWHPERVEQLRELAAAHPEVDVWIHPARFIGPDGRSLGLWRCPWPAGRPLEPAEWFPRLLVQNVLSVPGVAFRRSLLESVGYMDEEQPYTTDWDFWLRLARSSRAWVIPQPLADFRLHAESQTISMSRRHAEFVAQLEGVVARYRGELPSLGAAARWERLADLGVEVNAWLAARAARLPWPNRRLLRALGRAGIRGSLAYVRAAQLVPRVRARLRVVGLVQSEEESRGGQTDGSGQ